MESAPYHSFAIKKKFDLTALFTLAPHHSKQSGGKTVARSTTEAKNNGKSHGSVEIFRCGCTAAADRLEFCRLRASLYTCGNTLCYICASLERAKRQAPLLFGIRRSCSRLFRARARTPEKATLDNEKATTRAYRGLIRAFYDAFDCTRDNCVDLFCLEEW